MQTFINKVTCYFTFLDVLQRPLKEGAMVQLLGPPNLFDAQLTEVASLDNRHRVVVVQNTLKRPSSMRQPMQISMLNTLLTF
jgi:hypothetical protein